MTSQKARDTKFYVRHVSMVTSVGTRDRATAHLKFQYKTHVSQTLGIKVVFSPRLCKTESKSFSTPSHHGRDGPFAWFDLLDQVGTSVLQKQNILCILQSEQTL